jgi:hypothetical protein
MTKHVFTEIFKEGKTTLVSSVWYRFTGLVPFFEPSAKFGTKKNYKNSVALCVD